MMDEGELMRDNLGSIQHTTATAVGGVEKANDKVSLINFHLFGVDLIINRPIRALSVCL
jgi:hypothetical protein